MAASFLYGRGGPPDVMMRVSVEMAPGDPSMLTVGPPEFLFDYRYRAGLNGRNYAVSPDSKRFLMIIVGNEQVREAWLVCGRRAGKNFFVALVAVYLSCFRTYHLARGERGVFMVMAADRRQARVVMRYVKGFPNGSPMLASLAARETQTEIELTNGVMIEIHTASFKSVRGYTLVGAVCDEIAYWPTDESVSPDTEVLHALRPAMATVPGVLLLCISSPYARRGELWRAYRDHFGEDSEHVLVWHAATRTMNATVAQAVVDHAYADDPAVASAEYGAEFRRDLETFVSREAIDAVTVTGRQELPPLRGVSYDAFVDPSGGLAGRIGTATARFWTRCEKFGRRLHPTRSSQSLSTSCGCIE